MSNGTKPVCYLKPDTRLFGVPKGGARGPTVPKSASAGETVLLHSAGLSTMGYRQVYRLSDTLQFPWMNMRRYSRLTRVARVALFVTRTPFQSRAFASPGRWMVVRY